MAAVVETGAGMGVDLSSLVGHHILTAVNFDSSLVEGVGASCVINFVLDGVMYTAIEDPEDGYRSRMAELKITTVRTGRWLNTFVPCEVVGSMRNGNDDILDLADARTGNVVISVGTDYSDDYYPCFVSTFDPEAMVVNWNPPAMWGAR